MQNFDKAYIEDQIELLEEKLKTYENEEISLRTITRIGMDSILPYEYREGISVIEDELIKDVEMILISYGTYEKIKDNRSYKDTLKSKRLQLVIENIDISRELSKINTEMDVRSILNTYYEISLDKEFLYDNDSEIIEKLSMEIVPFKNDNRRTGQKITYKSYFDLIKSLYIQEPEHLKGLYNYPDKSSNEEKKDDGYTLLKCVRENTLEWRHRLRLILGLKNNTELNEFQVHTMFDDCRNSYMLESMCACVQLDGWREKYDIKIVDKAFERLIFYTLIMFKNFEVDSSNWIVMNSISNIITENKKQSTCDVILTDPNDSILELVSRFALYCSRTIYDSRFVRECRSYDELWKFIGELCDEFEDFLLKQDRELWLGSLIEEALLWCDEGNKLKIIELMDLVDEEVAKRLLELSDPLITEDIIIEKTTGIRNFQRYCKKTLNNGYVFYSNGKANKVSRNVGILYVSHYLVAEHRVAQRIKFTDDGIAQVRQLSSDKKSDRIAFKDYADYIKLLHSVSDMFEISQSDREQIDRILEKVYSPNLMIAIAKRVGKAMKKEPVLKVKDYDSILKSMLRLRCLKEVDTRRRYTDYKGETVYSLIHLSKQELVYEVSYIRNYFEPAIIKSTFDIINVSDKKEVEQLSRQYNASRTDVVHLGNWKPYTKVLNKILRLK